MHQPDRYGDIIARATAKQAELTGQRTAGIELGPLGRLSLRVVVPWDVAERRLELYGEAFTNTIGGMIITDRKAIIVDVNEAFERVTV